MKLTATIRDRGTTPRGMRKAYSAASREAWFATAVQFHTVYRDRRFTNEHALEAGYGRRKGELLARGTKAFQRSYTGRKLRMFGHTRPLEFTGETRNKMRAASISSTRNMGRAAYPGASKFSFKHPKSKIRMHEEFRRILPREASELGEYYDEQLDAKLKQLDT
jgi:hypothetical protein